MIRHQDQTNVRSVKVGEHGPSISHLSFDRSMDVRFRLITALRNTGIAVQSVQDAADANMFRSDSEKCRRNSRIPHALIHGSFF